MIRHSLYSEYVLARQQMTLDGMTIFVEIEQDQDEGMNYDLTPKNPLQRRFTEGEIDLFEDIYIGDMRKIHGI
ncbi:hypothetical protein CHH69_18505 [Terribacillus saccharophilus]|uniref:hypothetical protein n=1 Tax=Terribacillus saccharophilus TaxID=361277 RepID=UPI000BA4FF38|nr:hypothetical protein [Terribacillus saccharophilus]PAF33950.1 hypothetical protein CHH69_18505 [Terribacillus saccharophilus]